MQPKTTTHQLSSKLLLPLDPHTNCMVAIATPCTICAKVAIQTRVLIELTAEAAHNNYLVLKKYNFDLRRATVPNCCGNIDPLDEELHKSDVGDALAFGNHKGATEKPDLLKDLVSKDVKYGYGLPLLPI